MAITVLGMVAQMERRFIKERQREGIDRAKADGIYQGGKRRLQQLQMRDHRRGSGFSSLRLGEIGSGLGEVGLARQQEILRALSRRPCAGLLMRPSESLRGNTLAVALPSEGKTTRASTKNRERSLSQKFPPSTNKLAMSIPFMRMSTPRRRHSMWA
jgi:Resolvase, N terminal domain